MMQILEFLSTPSARRATHMSNTAYQRAVISIHALREEGDTVLSTSTISSVHFYPRPPRGGRRLRFHLCAFSVDISIHALREEGDGSGRASRQPENQNFYPRPPRGGRLGAADRIHRTTAISIHALREEGDYADARSQGYYTHFYPRPPRGGRLDGNSVDMYKIKFLSTPSARRATG